MRASPLTDALARSGIMAARDALPALYRQQSVACLLYTSRCV